MELTPDRKKFCTGRLLRTVLLVLALCGFLFLGEVVWFAYQDDRNEALLAARSQAELIEARLDATLRRVDADLSMLLDTFPPEALTVANAERYRSGIEKRLAQLGQAFPEVAGFEVMDASGKVLYLAHGGVYADLGDRPYFAQLSQGQERALVFSGVLDSRVSGRKSMIAARAIVGPQGQFLGAVSAAIELDYFDRLFQSVRLGAGGMLAIRHRSTQAMIVGQPDGAEAILQDLFASSAIDIPASGPFRSETIQRSRTDGVSRVYAFRAVSAYPFYVVAAFPDAEPMAWGRQRIYWVAGLGLVDFLCLAAFSLYLFRLQRRERETVQVLRKREAQLRDAQRLAQLGYWELDPKLNCLTGTDEFFRLFEFEAGEQPLSYERLLARMHPEDRALVDRTYRQSVSEHQPFQAEYRLAMPDGRIKNVRTCGETEYDNQGRPLRSVGTIQDITGLRLLESQTHLLGSAFQHSGEAIVITDGDNRVVTVNPAFTRLTGYSLEEAKGRNPSFLSAGNTSKDDYRKMWEAIGEHDFWQGEIWDRRKDGGVYPKWMSISVIRDADGKVCYYIAHFTDVSVERAVEAKLQHVAHHDTLTGLFNRLSLQSRLEQALAAARRDGGRVALLFIDLDRFKVINDTVGHHVGDKLLIEVAQRLRENVRDSDVVARLGGDEFIVMLTGIEHSGAAALVATKIVASIGDPYRIDGYDLYTTPSVGIAIFPTDGDDGETLMKNADAAMYHAKAAGRNNFQFFDSRMNDAAIERLRMEHSLRQALAHDEFCLHFQPIIELSSGRVQSVEALVRWMHPEQGLILPGRFIGLAEECGLIQPLGEWVFWSACRQLADFRAAGLKDIRMGVNISSMQMRNGNLPVLARGAIEAFALEPASLVFEITESVAMQQPEETVRILDILHNMGVSLAIDDFGTGYSSLSYLRMFPIDHLKLDRSFVREIGEDADSAAICDATIGLAHNLGMKLVAEGVETEAQLDYLRRQGCDLVQGYLFSRPVPADEIVAFIRQRNV